jgi:hypothetical protein
VRRTIRRVMRFAVRPLTVLAEQAEDLDGLIVG